MKFKHIKGLKLQKPSYLKTSNEKIRDLLDGKEVELSKENLEEFESLGVQVQPVKKEQPKKEKVKKEE